MMRERAKAIGASLSIASEPGAGAEIVVRWTAEPA
jgi:signal transduction histidine kinase